jgi:hypothetical protein
MWLRSAARSAIVAALAASTLAPAKALETSDLVGWWIALDDTLPKLWKQGAIKAQEEVLQVTADGTVSDRVMNFWAGGAQACLEGKVCSDLPELATAKIAVNSNYLSFREMKPTPARIDSVAGNLLIRQEAVTATPEWTAQLDGQRLTLRAIGVAKVRTLVRIEPDRLRRLHAGMRASTWSPEDHWRCFLGNATMGDGAFAPLRANRSIRAPEFLERYLKLASYMTALRSAAALPGDAVDETTKAALAATPPEELMPLSFEGVSRTPSAEDKKRYASVLTYIDQHAKATVALNAATATATAARARAAAAAREASGKETAAKSASDAVTAAEAKIAAASAEHERIRAQGEQQAQSAKDAAAAAKTAEILAALKEKTSNAAASSAEATRRIALAQQHNARAARNYAAEQQQRHQDTIREATEQNQAVEQASAAIEPQKQKAAAKVSAAAEQQTKADEARFAADTLRRKYEAVRLAAVQQQQKGNLFVASAQAFADSLAEVQKASEATAALIEKGKARRVADAGGAGAADAALIDEAVREASGTAAALAETLNTAIAARNKANDDAQVALAKTAEMVRAAQAMEKQTAEATEAATAAQKLADEAKVEADTASREVVRLMQLARNAEIRAAEGAEATKATEAAYRASELAAEAEEKQAAEFSAPSETIAKKAREALTASQAAIAARMRAARAAEDGTAEATRSTETLKRAAAALAAAQGAAKQAAAVLQERNAQFQAASQASEQAAAEAKVASDAESALSDAVRAAAAAQPKGSGLLVIATADITALAHVIGESRDAKRLFCDGQIAAAEPAIAAPPALPLRPQPAAATPAVEARPAEFKPAAKPAEAKPAAKPAPKPKPEGESKPAEKPAETGKKRGSENAR